MRGPNRWLALFVGTRAIATTAGVGLLLAHSVTEHHRLLAVLTVLYGGGTIAAVIRWPVLQRSPVAWALDAGVLLALIVATDTWRSPFYVLGLTALIFPATELPFRRAIAFGAIYTAAYFAIAGSTGIAWETLRQTYKLESFATHLMVPLIIVTALAYAAAVLRQLQDERMRTERLAVQTERRRIAWELHDSAKQRVHAAHLMMSQLRRQQSGPPNPLLEQALAELGAATTDIDTSLTELRSPLADVGLGESLRRRATELDQLSDARIEVVGEAPGLPTTVAAHAFRVVGEALTNAVRHSHAERIRVEIEHRNGRLRAIVSDDGEGMPTQLRPGSNGIRSMRARAGTLGGTLEIRSGERSLNGHGLGTEPDSTGREPASLGTTPGNGAGASGERGGERGTAVILDVPADGAPAGDGRSELRDGSVPVARGV